MTEGPQPVHAPEPEHAPPPVYSSVEDFVTEHFLFCYRRALGGAHRWCAQWWRHDEAVERLTALWHSWEALRLQPGTGIAVWHRDYLDCELPALMSCDGTFALCTPDRHADLPVARAVPAPPYWLPDAAHGTGDPAPGVADPAGGSAAWDVFPAAGDSDETGWPDYPPARPLA